MADEKKSVDIGTYYARQEMVRFAEVWKDVQEKIEGLMSVEEPDGDTLSDILKTVDGLKKSVKPMNYMAVLLAKQKACEKFLEEKGLTDEFADFTMQ